MPTISFILTVSEYAPTASKNSNSSFDSMAKKESFKKDSFFSVTATFIEF